LLLLLLLLLPGVLVSTCVDSPKLNGMAALLLNFGYSCLGWWWFAYRDALERHKKFHNFHRALRVDIVDMWLYRLWCVVLQSQKAVQVDLFIHLSSGMEIEWFVVIS